MLRYGLWLAVGLAACVAGCNRQAKVENKASVAAVAASKPAGAPPPGLESEAEQRAASHCVDQWNSEMSNRENTRQHTAREKARGHQGVPEHSQKQRDQAVMVRFLPSCERFGFSWPPIVANNTGAENANTALAARLEAEVDKRRRDEEQAFRQAQAQEEAQRAVDQQAREEAVKRESCRQHLAALDDARVQVARQPEAERAESLANIDSQAAEVRARCAS